MDGQINYPAAIKLYKQAIEYDYSRAYCQLGVLYEEGLGLQKDEKKAFKCYAKAAMQGDEVAQCYLAIVMRWELVLNRIYIGSVMV